jgi:hypothetical protein
MTLSLFSFEKSGSQSRVSKLFGESKGVVFCATNQGWNFKNPSITAGTEKLAGRQSNTGMPSRHEPWDGLVSHTLDGGRIESDSGVTPNAT